MNPIQPSRTLESNGSDRDALRVSFLVLCVLAVNLLGGCGKYVLEGRVVMGEYSTVELVEPDDRRLNDTPAPGVTVEVVRDPMSLGRKTVGKGTSGGTGVIRLSIGEFGAGFLQEEWELRVVRNGSEFASSNVELPYDSNSRRLLVVIRRGDGRTRNSLGVEAERQLKNDDLILPTDSAIFR